MSANFDFLIKRAKLTIWVAEETITDKLLDWEKEFPGIKVNSIWQNHPMMVLCWVQLSVNH